MFTDDAHTDEELNDQPTASDAAGSDDSSQDDELSSLKEELKKAREQAARAQADLQNAKSRAEKEAVEIRKYAAEAVIRRILPTLDNFSRAFSQIPEELKSHEWVKGVAAIESDLMKQMSEAGLKRMESMGATVDPQIHEVLSVSPGKDGAVLQVFEEGYELNGKVIRPAKVVAGEGE